jgi:hypothetical protein
MKVSFQHPDTGIPCIGEWDEEGEVLFFDFEDYEEAVKYNSVEDIEITRKWCMRNSINCDSEVQANNHLAYLGIKERLEY